MRVPEDELTCDEQGSVPAGLRPSGLQTHEAHLELLLLGLRSGEHPAVPGLLHHGGDAHRAAELQPARTQSLEAGRRLREHRCWKMEEEKPQRGAQPGCRLADQQIFILYLTSLSVKRRDDVSGGISTEIKRGCN